MAVFDIVGNYIDRYPVLERIEYILGVLLLAIVLYFISKKILLKIIQYIVKKSENTWDDVILEKGVFNKLAYIVPALAIHQFSYLFGKFFAIVERGVSAYIVLILILVAVSFLDALGVIFESHDLTKDKPIKGILQILVIIIYLLGAIVIVAVLIGKSPVILLSGIGALTAVLMLVFKDTLLCFVASLQISYNNLIKKGDWITMPKYNADGTVIDIALYNLKIQNFDQTITSIPTQKFLEESFTNWRGMQESEARRIARAINIDISSIKFLDDETLKAIKQSPRLKEFNTEGITPAMTNLEAYMQYMKGVLAANPKIHQGMSLLVRQLAPTEKGVPVQFWAFTYDKEWPKYEALQTSLISHALAIAAEFGIKIFQDPSGGDLGSLIK